MNLRKVWHHPLDPDIRPATNLPMRIKRVTALAYLHLLEEQKIKNQVTLEHFLWKGKVDHLIKTGCTPKKSEFLFTSNIKNSKQFSSKSEFFYSLQTLKKYIF